MKFYQSSKHIFYSDTDFSVDLLHHIGYKHNMGKDVDRLTNTFLILIKLLVFNCIDLNKNGLQLFLYLKGTDMVSFFQTQQLIRYFLFVLNPQISCLAHITVYEYQCN